MRHAKLLTLICHVVFPIFLQHSKRLMAVTAPKEGSKGIDFFVHTHHAIAEAMLTLVLGEVRFVLF